MQSNNNRIAVNILHSLNQKGAGLGNASIQIIEKCLDESPSVNDPSVLVEALERIHSAQVPDGEEFNFDPGQFIYELKGIARKAIADYKYPGMTNHIKAQSTLPTLPTQSPSSIEESGFKEGEHVWPLPEQYKTDSPYKAAVYFGWYHGLVNGYTHKFTWEEYLKTHPLRKPKENEPELTEHQQEILSLFSKEELWDIVNYWDKIKKS